MWTFRSEGQKEDYQWGSLWTSKATCMGALSDSFFVLNCSISMLLGGQGNALICCYVFCLIWCIIPENRLICAWLPICAWLRTTIMIVKSMDYRTSWLGLESWLQHLTKPPTSKDFCFLHHHHHHYCGYSGRLPHPPQSYRIFHHFRSIILLQESYIKMQTPERVTLEGLNQLSP